MPSPQKKLALWVSVPPVLLHGSLLIPLGWCPYFHDSLSTYFADRVRFSLEAYHRLTQTMFANFLGASQPRLTIVNDTEDLDSSIHGKKVACKVTGESS